MSCKFVNKWKVDANLMVFFQYPKNILKIDYDPNFSIRGLHCDVRKVLKSINYQLGISHRRLRILPFVFFNIYRPSSLPYFLLFDKLRTFLFLEESHHSYVLWTWNRFICWKYSYFCTEFLKKKKYNHASAGIDVLLSQQTDQITVEMITLK